MLTPKRSTRWKRLLVGSFLLATISSLAYAQSSTKELNETTGRALVKEAVSKRNYMVPISSIGPLLHLSLKDYTRSNGGEVEAVFRELLSRNLVQQHVETLTYSKVSGRFSAQGLVSTGAGNESRWEQTTWVLDTLPERPVNDWSLGPTALRLAGITYSETHEMGIQRTGNIEVGGAITPDGRIVLSTSGGFLWKGFYREEGGNAVLQLQEQRWVRLPGQGQGWTRFVGKAAGQKIAVKWYQYSVNPEFNKQIIRTPQGPYIAAGKFEIGAVSGLKLVRETEAVAHFAWKVSPNALGSIFLEHKEPGGTGTVSFAKKPDGTWFVDEVSFD